MNFFDLDPGSFSKSSQFYFNVLVINVAISPQYAKEYFGNELIYEINYLEKLTDTRPTYIHFYVDELDEDAEFEMSYEPHCVVEVDRRNNVYWYDMLDFMTDDPWRIDTYDEDCENW